MLFDRDFGNGAFFLVASLQAACDCWMFLVVWMWYWEQLWQWPTLGWWICPYSVTLLLCPERSLVVG